MRAMSLRVAFRLAVLGAALSLLTEVRAAFPERKIFQFGEFTIEASAGDEAYVEALALTLVDYRIPVQPEVQPGKLSLDDLARRREYFLGKVAAELGLPKPTDKMGEVYGTMLNLWRNVTLSLPHKLPHHYALWRRPELLARLDAGEKIPGFSKDASGGLGFSFDFGMSASPGEGIKDTDLSATMAASWDQLVCPIKIGAEGDKTPAEDMTAGLAGITAFLFTGFRDAILNAQRQSVFNVLHEATESGVVWHYLTSKDRRWFCDGVANYVALKVIEAELGPDDARTYYDLPAELQKYAGEAGRIDLAAWPAAENQGAANYAENLNTANYAFATKVIADICAKHGDALLPSLFQLIGRTPREKATMGTVFKAYKKLTGEDLHAYLPRPPAKG
jgi:hypothetical protein